jgi:hypothetical protein
VISFEPIGNDPTCFLQVKTIANTTTEQTSSIICQSTAAVTDPPKPHQALPRCMTLGTRYPTLPILS